MRVISLFSGAGGLDLGFLRAGHKVVWANDIDPDCVKTYSANIGHHIVLGDIRTTRAPEIPSGEIVVGGFPCQGFSLANLRRRGSDARNVLYREFVRILRSKRPPYFVAENVRGLLSLERGRVMDLILEEFSRVGYSVTYRLVNMADYGVPQTRSRVIIMGVRKDLPLQAHPKFPEATHSRHARASGRATRPWLTIREALKGIPEPSTRHHGLLNHIFSKYKVTNRNFTGHRRTDPRKPSPTILARGNGEGGVCAIQHYRNHRRMSVRESALIQTFPKEFEFFGGLNSMYRQVGNAVPVLFAERLAEEFSRVEAHLPPIA